MPRSPDGVIFRNRDAEALRKATHQAVETVEMA